jgi:hypothetical protein
VTRKNISLEELQRKLERGAIRKRTARRYIERMAAKWLKSPEYKKLKEQKKTEDQS